jgi:hypothetical protein
MGDGADRGLCIDDTVKAPAETATTTEEVVVVAVAAPLVLLVLVLAEVSPLTMVIASPRGTCLVGGDLGTDENGFRFAFSTRDRLLGCALTPSLTRARGAAPMPDIITSHGASASLATTAGPAPSLEDSSCESETYTTLLVSAWEGLSAKSAAKSISSPSSSSAAAAAAAQDRVGDACALPFPPMRRRRNGEAGDATVVAVLPHPRPPLSCLGKTFAYLNTQKNEWAVAVGG